MSILLGYEIKKGVESGDIHISHFDTNQLNPNSYDVRLDQKLKVYTMENGYLDFHSKNDTITLTIPNKGYILQPGLLYLGSTIEEAGSDKYIPMIEGRTSAARLGIQTHISAGFGDIGFKNRWTLEITVIHHVLIYPGDKIAQIYFHRVDVNALSMSESVEGHNTYYSGKYKDQTLATESKSYLDYEYPSDSFNN